MVRFQTYLQIGLCKLLLRNSIVQHVEEYQTPLEESVLGIGYMLQLVTPLLIQAIQTNLRVYGGPCVE